jgi:polysaccharide export outer membrane protein
MCEIFCREALRMKPALLACALFLLFATPALAGDYVIGEGDGLDIAVWGVRDLTFATTVRPDGKITVPGLGDVAVGGYTPVGLQAVLEKQLKALVKNPIVTVTVRVIANSKVYFFGSGVNSGVYDLNRRTTLLQLLCTIGSSAGAAVQGAGTAAMTKVPDYRRAYVLRNGKKIKENLHPLFVTGDIAEDIVIEPNDAVYIPQLLERNIYVLGAVNASRAIEYREGLTVMESILEAGGFSKFAKQNDVAILRKEGDKEISIEVKAKDLLKEGDLTQNVKLKPGDYVIVKESLF